MAAYKAAIDDGADGFECDVRITKDNQLLLWHDADMQRVAGSAARIADSTLSDIKDYYPEAMTLEELLILARDNKKELAIETKHPVPTGSAVERKVVELLAQEKPVADIHIMSFSWLALEKVRMISPKQSTVALLHDRFSFAMRRFTSAGSIGPGISSLRSNPHLLEDPRNLFVWTVDDADDMRFCANNGVDVLITNNPSNARSVLGYH
ncbi:UgpQ Glycerophosphoryl diester phosphodiesterase [Candidatus Nanopelagicaceae bacterium]